MDDTSILPDKGRVVIDPMAFCLDCPAREEGLSSEAAPGRDHDIAPDHLEVSGAADQGLREEAGPLEPTGGRLTPQFRTELKAVSRKCSSGSALIGKIGLWGDYGFSSQVLQSMFRISGSE